MTFAAGMPRDFFKKHRGSAGMIAHGIVHTVFGSQMGQCFSPADPVFWMHHAFIDRIWYVWQQGGPQQPRSRLQVSNLSSPQIMDCSFVPCGYGVRTVAIGAFQLRARRTQPLSSRLCLYAVSIVSNTEIFVYFW